MALFGKSKKETKEVKAASEPVAGSDVAYRILRAPRITEKATLATDRGAYVFDVDPHATKTDIKKAVQAVYKVTPIKVNVVSVPAKKVESRFRKIRGVKAGGRKAYVYLKQGDTIELM